MSESLENLSRTESPSFSVRVYENRSEFVTALERLRLAPEIQPDNSIVVENADPQLSALIWQAARDANTNIQSLIPARNSLEEIFMSTVKDASETTQQQESVNADS